MLCVPEKDNRVKWSMRNEQNMKEARNGKPILITGSHRSGSTWVGKTIAFSHDVGYIQEPFNPQVKLSVNSFPLRYWFQCLDEKNKDPYVASLRHLLAYKYPFFRNMSRAGCPRDIVRVVRAVSVLVVFM